MLFEFLAKREAKWNPGETAAQQKAHYDVSRNLGVDSQANEQDADDDQRRLSMKPLEWARSGF